ncbi:hypothetical protein RFI_17625 [Reticulomyxa filosa]|uniref:Uncharacterized protein n=1 Tax=Reticulomyxa filosa TaxID=46433 RepID=X6N1J1_RETFI|nr:hypothetical protein RFI_17625 [Reticulomyxa filosa]|eukprot:ETO19604.1 hypothetical protein RFI_17625 [Reticulomyxa filosa]
MSNFERFPSWKATRKNYKMNYPLQKQAWSRLKEIFIPCNSFELSSSPFVLSYKKLIIIIIIIITRQHAELSEQKAHLQQKFTDMVGENGSLKNDIASLQEQLQILKTQSVLFFFFYYLSAKVEIGGERGEGGEIYVYRTEHCHLFVYVCVGEIKEETEKQLQQALAACHREERAREQLEAQLEMFGKELELKRSELSVLEKLHEELNQRYSELCGKYENTCTELQTLQQRLDFLQQKCASFEIDIREKTQQNQLQKEDIERLTTEYKTLQSGHNSVKEQLAVAQHELTEWQAKVKSLETQVTGFVYTKFGIKTKRLHFEYTNK